jgi:hypothetical protein
MGYRCACRKDDIDLQTNQLCRQLRQFIIPSASKAPLYDDVLTFEITQLS